ncbi:hypothetical protein GCM10009525_69160 [Streptosporangium amethystogenes subsp. fukuiense]
MDMCSDSGSNKHISGIEGGDGCPRSSLRNLLIWAEGMHTGQVANMTVPVTDKSFSSARL